MISDAITKGSPEEPRVKMPDVMVPDHASGLRDLSANDPFLVFIIWLLRFSHPIPRPGVKLLIGFGSAFFGDFCKPPGKALGTIGA